jgi:hypothetical protein
MTPLKPEVTNIISHLLKIEDANGFRCIDMLDYFSSKNTRHAPGSSANHQACDGGYYKHISDILDYADKMYKYLSKAKKLDFPPLF